MTVSCDMSYNDQQIYTTTCTLPLRHYTAHVISCDIISSDVTFLCVWAQYELSNKTDCTSSCSIQTTDLLVSVDMSPQTRQLNRLAKYHVYINTRISLYTHSITNHYSRLSYHPLNFTYLLTSIFYSHHGHFIS